MSNRYLITGGAGFIGSNFIHYILDQEPDSQVLNLDKLTYAGNLESLESVSANPHYQFLQIDICDSEKVKSAVQTFQPNSLIHFAAESHVDRSIDGPAEFIQTNVFGTFTLLEKIRVFWNRLENREKQDFRFLHVSTDEVYGTLGEDGFFTEETAYAPNSPYAASKASSDHLVRAWFHTYNLPVLTSNCSNNYGPCQFPEKLIPLMIMNAIGGKSLPVYGDGSNIRDWLYVKDHCRAIHSILNNGKPGECYNIGGNNEMTNLEVVQNICEILDKLKPKSSGSYQSQITFVKDRPGHDQRYAIDAGTIQREMGWYPQESFQTGLEKTIQWYLKNLTWVNNILSGKYKMNRLGLSK